MQFALYFPVKPKHVNQGFGRANTAPSALQTYLNLGLSGHNGLDLQAGHGEPIYAAHDGRAFYEFDSNQGEGVVLITDQPFDYKDGQAYFKSIMWHMADPIKEPSYASPVWKFDQQNPGKGMPVKAGDLIGYADNTGLSTGDHCHFGLKPIWPGAGVNMDATDFGIGDFHNLEANNGYFGAIDPTPYFNNLFAQDIKAISAGVDASQKAAHLIIEGAGLDTQVKISMLQIIVNFLRSLLPK